MLLQVDAVEDQVVPLAVPGVVQRRGDTSGICENTDVSM